MIVDAIYNDDGPPTVYTRWRGTESRSLFEHRQLDYRPHFFLPAHTPEYRIKKMLRSFPTAQVVEGETFTALDKTKLLKVEADSPYDIHNMAMGFTKTYEADVMYPDQYLINNVAEMPKWKPRKWWYDIECDTGDDNFTTVIAVIDSDLDTPVVFAWADERTNCPLDTSYGMRSGPMQKSVRDTEYDLYLYGSEKEMYDNFIVFLNQRDPDMMIAHAGTFFDIPHMIERLDKIYGHGGASKLSPLGVIRYPKKGKRYRYDAQPIAGRWQFDTAAPEGSGTGFERVWKDSGGGQLPNLKLNTIAETLGLGSKLTEEIDGMTVHNGWYEYWSEFVDYCLLDTVLLRGIDEAHNVTDFFVEMVRLTGVSLSSVSNVTNFARGLISRRTGLKAPSRYQAQREDLKGAEFIKKDNGLYENVAVLDYKGLYPSLMTGYNLCWTTKRDGPGEDVLRMENGTYWYQGEKGILPIIVDYLFDYRDVCKQNMRDAKTKQERAAWNTTQSAVKRVMASLYGLTAHAGYGWADMDIAETILSEGRRCIALLDTVATDMGYNVIYGFTDSAFIQVPLEDAERLAKRVTDVVQEQTGNKKLFAELEAYMDYWYLETNNRYAGIVSYPEADKGKWKNAQLMKGSGKAPISKRAERTVLELICTGASEGDVREAVLEMVKPLRRGEYNLKEITQWTRIGVFPSKTPAAQGAQYYNEHIVKDKRDAFVKGNSVAYLYVSHPPIGKPPTKYAAYREEEDLDGFEIDKKAVIEKLVERKIKAMFKVLGWDLEAAMGAPRPATYW
jgi:DNA polymerase I